jgi:putative membrane protein
MRIHFIIGVAASAILTLAACDGAKTAENTATPTETASATDPAVTPASTTPDADAQVRKAQDFVNAAAQANLVEIRTAEMAVDRASSPDVKAFAKTLIADHKKANEDLKTIAAAASLAPPPETLDDFHMRRINDLNETDGDKDFDHDFMALQVDAHKDTIDLFNDYAKDGDVAPLKSFAEQTLPKLEEHRTKAEAVEKTVKPS